MYGLTDSGQRHHGCITVELTRRRESKHPSPHQASCERRYRRSRPTICYACRSEPHRLHWNNFNTKYTKAETANISSTPRAILFGEKPTCAVLQPYFGANTFSPNHSDTRCAGKARIRSSHQAKAAFSRSSTPQKLTNNKSRPSFTREILRPLYLIGSDSSIFNSSF